MNSRYFTLYCNHSKVEIDVAHFLDPSGGKRSPNTRQCIFLKIEVYSDHLVCTLKSTIGPIICESPNGSLNTGSLSLLFTGAVVLEDFIHFL